jgi:hypothetical protein
MHSLRRRFLRTAPVVLRQVSILTAATIFSSTCAFAGLSECPKSNVDHPIKFVGTDATGSQVELNIADGRVVSVSYDFPRYSLQELRNIKPSRIITSFAGADGDILQGAFRPSSTTDKYMLMVSNGLWKINNDQINVFIPILLNQNYISPPPEQAVYSITGSIGKNCQSIDVQLDKVNFTEKYEMNFDIVLHIRKDLDTLPSSFKISLLRKN